MIEKTEVKPEVRISAYQLKPRYREYLRSVTEILPRHPQFRHSQKFVSDIRLFSSPHPNQLL
jgi:hypothetical protein